MTASATLLSPEARLLFLTAGGAAHDGAIAALARGPVDWTRLAALADEERAGSVVWRRLAAVAGGEADPAGVLRRQAMVSDFSMGLLEGRLRGSVGVLRSAGIDVVLLKGAAMACAVFGSFAARPMLDLDLLVRAEDAPRAADALLGDGWVWHPQTSAEQAYDGHQHLRPLYDHRVSRKNLELHVGLFGSAPFALGADDVWRDSREVAGAGGGVRVPSAMHLVLHSCIHFAWMHEMDSGGWRTFRDLAALTAGPGFDWDGLVRAAREARAASCCYWTLRLGALLAGLAVPAEVERALAPRRPGPLTARLARHLAGNVVESERSCPSQLLGRKLWELAIVPGASGHGAARPWGERVALPDDAEALRLPDLTRRHARLARRWLRYAGAVLS